MPGLSLNARTFCIIRLVQDGTFLVLRLRRSLDAYPIIGCHGYLAGAARAVRVGRRGLAVHGARVRVTRSAILVVVADLRILTRKRK